MSTIEKSLELEEAVRFAMTGEADPEILRRIAERSAQIQEELRKKYGTMDVAVSLIREIRDEDE